MERKVFSPAVMLPFTGSVNCNSGACTGLLASCLLLIAALKADLESEIGAYQSFARYAPSARAPACDGAACSAGNVGRSSGGGGACPAGGTLIVASGCTTGVGVVVVGGGGCATGVGVVIVGCGGCATGVGVVIVGGGGGCATSVGVVIGGGGDCATVVGIAVGGGGCAGVGVGAVVVAVVPVAPSTPGKAASVVVVGGGGGGCATSVGVVVDGGGGGVCDGCGGFGIGVGVGVGVGVVAVVPVAPSTSGCAAATFCVGTDVVGVDGPAISGIGTVAVVVVVCGSGVAAVVAA